MTADVCAAIAPELVAFLDGEIDEEARRPIAAHLGTCLGCRRELERLGRTRRLLEALPPVTPSAAFAAGLWERLAAEDPPPASRVRPLRPVRWALPALAAAAVVALALSSQLRAPATPPAAPVPAAPIAAAPPPAPEAVVARPPEVEQAQVARAVSPRAEELEPEDLPSELLDNAELFLRLPVVRRLDTLEHFESVQHSQEGEEGAG